MVEPSTVRYLLQEARHVLTGSDSAALDARLLLEHTLGITHEELIHDPNKPVEATEAQHYRALIERRREGEPVAQIIGHKEFWGLDFRVTRDTLTPRPDSETLIETVLSLPYPKQAPEHVFDLGTGSGCLLITLLSHWPQARGLAIDISFEALRIARENAARHSVDRGMDCVQGTWLEGIAAKADLIVSNPPYIAETDRAALAPDVREYEPETALFAGRDGLDAYRTILRDAPRHLAPEGWLALELGAGQATQVTRLVEQNGMRVHAITKDLAGIERCLIARLQ